MVSDLSSEERRTKTLPRTYVTDPVNCPAQPFSFQHAHAPKKECDSGRTEDRLIQINLKRATYKGVNRPIRALPSGDVKKDVLGRSPL